MEISAKGIYGIVLGIIFTGSACIWIGAVSSVGAPAFLSLFGIPFVAVGIWIVYASARGMIKVRKEEKYRPQTYEDFLRSQEEKEKSEEQDDDASRLSTDGRRRMVLIRGSGRNIVSSGTPAGRPDDDKHCYRDRERHDQRVTERNSTVEQDLVPCKQLTDRQKHR